jgi:hypothetical protein
MPGMRALGAAGAMLGMTLVLPWAVLLTSLDYLDEQPVSRRARLNGCTAHGPACCAAPRGRPLLPGAGRRSARGKLRAAQQQAGSAAPGGDEQQSQPVNVPQEGASASARRSCSLAAHPPLPRFGRFLPQSAPALCCRPSHRPPARGAPFPQETHPLAYLVGYEGINLPVQLLLLLLEPRAPSWLSRPRRIAARQAAHSLVMAAAAAVRPPPTPSALARTGTSAAT